MSHPHSNTNTSMIGPPPSFYDPQQEWGEYPAQPAHPQGQGQGQGQSLGLGQGQGLQGTGSEMGQGHGQGHGHAHAQFDFAYPAPGTSYDELLAQFYPQQQAYTAPTYQQQTQPQTQSYNPPVPSTSTSTAKNPNANGNTNNTRDTSSNTASAPKRKRVTKKAAPAPAPSYSDNSDSDDGFSFGGGSGGGGGAGISVGMAGLGVRSRGARLPGACTHCKKLKMKCDFGPAPAGGDGEDEGGNGARGAFFISFHFRLLFVFAFPRFSLCGLEPRVCVCVCVCVCACLFSRPQFGICILRFFIPGRDTQGGLGRRCGPGTGLDWISHLGLRGDGRAGSEVRGVGTRCHSDRPPLAQGCDCPPLCGEAFVATRLSSSHRLVSSPSIVSSLLPLISPHISSSLPPSPSSPSPPHPHPHANPSPSATGLDNTCRRCRAGGHVCIVEGRKPRSAPK
ncbi:hypothetical protein B0H11DRAFT_1149991 [Mycena galericulata]|nr:hypothetical protein B0H11DRAFT_1149991 [Mycena galericulata]